MSADDTTAWGRLIVEELCRLGADRFCIGAGSRSTPLTVAAAENTKATTKVFVDERSAAFYALGLAKATGRPAVLITTSGTAMANAMPAVIEAKESKTPMILISADRPPELQGNGANQTIDQTKLFGSQVLAFIGLPCPSPEVSLKHLLGRIGLAYQSAMGISMGPVHINAPFRKPLGPTQLEMPSPWPSESAWSRRFSPSLGLTEDSLRFISEFVGGDRTGIIVIGALNSTDCIRDAKQIISESSWPAFVDISAGFQTEHSLPMTLVQSNGGKALLTDLPILHLGGTTVSTGAAEIIEKASECLHISLSEDDIGPGEGRKTIIKSALIHLTGLKWSASNDLKKRCLSLQSAIEMGLDGMLSNQFSETAVIWQISQMLNGDLCSFWSNSMPVRDGNALVKWSKEDHRIGTNRGASGIDGIISTAAGFQEGTQKPCVLIIGDLATWHDLGALMQITLFQQPLLIVVLNNGGGGIFSFLPISQLTTSFESHFATAHDFKFKDIIAACGIECHQATTMKSLETKVSSFIAHPRPMAIEGSFHRHQNVQEHRAIMNVIESCITADKS